MATTTIPKHLFQDAPSGAAGFTRGGGIGATLVPIRPKQWKLNPITAIEDVYDALQLEMAQFAVKMRTYPPPKTDGRYVRTYNLQESWHVGFRRGIAIDVFNTSYYAAFVYGNNVGAIQQGPPWHAPGWPNMYEEFQKVKPALIRHAQANLNKWANQ